MTEARTVVTDLPRATIASERKKILARVATTDRNVNTRGSASRERNKRRV